MILLCLDKKNTFFEYFFVYKKILHFLLLLDNYIVFLDKKTSMFFVVFGQELHKIWLMRQEKHYLLFLNNKQPILSVN